MQSIVVDKNCSVIAGNIVRTDDYINFLQSSLLKRRVLLVHGKHSYYECGGAAFISSLQELAKFEYYSFSDFSNNPKSEDVVKGVEVALSYQPDVVVAIGGGSVLDMAKLVRYESKISVPLVAIPTTSGTGAESTQFAVCYIDGEKHSISHPSMLPDIVVLNPELTMNNSRYLTACTGFDALAQAIEAYWNINATEKSDSYARSAFILLFDCINNFASDCQYCMSNRIWREKMLIGANLAGQAINISRTTAPHAMSYKLTSKYGYPHGHAVALTFPFFAKLNMECQQKMFAGNDYEGYKEKMQFLKNYLGVERQDIELYFRDLVVKLGLGYRNDSGVDYKLVSQSINIERAKNNPFSLTDDIVNLAAQSIYKNI